MPLGKNSSGESERRHQPFFLLYQVPGTGKEKLGCCIGIGGEAAADIHHQEAGTSGGEHAGRGQAGTSQDT